MEDIPESSVLELLVNRPSLTALSLGGTYPKWDYARLDRINGLRSLNINLYQDAPDLSQLRIPQLRALSLFGIRDDQIPTADQFPQLVYLTVGGSPITDSGMKKIAERFPHLRYLHIALTHVTAGCIDDLSKLSHLRGLVCGESPLADTLYQNPQELDRLKRALPDCHINTSD